MLGRSVVTPWLVTLSLTLSGACSNEPADLPEIDLGARDAGADAATADAAIDDGGQGDFGPLDLGAEDLGPTDAGSDAGAELDAALDAAMGPFGTIAGPCGELDTELTEAAPSYFTNRLDFGTDAFDDPAERPLLTLGAQEILAEGTAGGSSGLSEAFAYEVLARCEGASLLKSETEIDYVMDWSGSITDMLVTIGGERIGVSVTRAFVFPPTDPYTVDRATSLLTDKLGDVLESSMGVAPADAWAKQILAVVAYGDMHADSIATAWASLDPALRADTIVYVIITDGADMPLY